MKKQKQEWEGLEGNRKGGRGCGRGRPVRMVRCESGNEWDST